MREHAYKLTYTKFDDTSSIYGRDRCFGVDSIAPYYRRGRGLRGQIILVNKQLYIAMERIRSIPIFTVNNSVKVFS